MGKLVKVFFPLKGQDDNWPRDGQPPDTSPSLMNCRRYDRTGRGCGSVRSGTTLKYTSGNAVSRTDLSMHGTDNKKIKSAANPFDADDILSVLRITGGTGWTLGTYTILAGPDGSGYMTLSASPAATAATAGVGTVNRLTASRLLVTTWNGIEYVVSVNNGAVYLNGVAVTSGAMSNTCEMAAGGGNVYFVDGTNIIHMLVLSTATISHLAVDTDTGTGGAQGFSGGGGEVISWDAGFPTTGTYTNDLAAGNELSTILGSESYDFTASHVGRQINITAGTNFIPGWYEIVSVVLSEGQWFAHLDRPCSTDYATAGSGYLRGVTGATGVCLNAVAVWRNRLVVADGPNIRMSRVNVHTDFDSVTPPLTDTARPFSVTHSDRVIGMMPWTADNLILMCERSFARFAGDPAQGGGLMEIDKGTGGINGRAWVSAQGRLWILTTDGLCAYDGANLAPVLRGQLNNWFKGLTASSNVAMAWDVSAQGPLLFDTSGTAAQTHLFYDIQAGGWFPFSFTDPAHAPGSVAQGGAVTFINTADGRILYLDATAKDDGPEHIAIPAYAYIGPISVYGPDYETKLLRIDLTFGDLPAGHSAGDFAVNWSVHVGRTPAEALAASASASGSFAACAATTQCIPLRLKGRSIFVKLAAAAAKYWSLDHMLLTVERGGRVML